MKVNQIEVVNSYLKTPLKTNPRSMVSRDSLLKNCTGQSSKSNWWLDLILVELLLLMRDFLLQIKGSTF